MKVVIADDSSLFRDRIKDLLKDLNNVEIVGEAVNRLEALKLIEDKKPDLAILDIRMPEMTGIEVLRKIRERKIKIIICMVTGQPYKQYKERCLAEGVDYFFDKTQGINQMLDVISGLANSEKGV
jgi:DNA-binding NarL/FixJ family response regulator